MKLIYKKIYVAVEHCADCGDRLSGNNSIVSPFRCSCGEWEWTWEHDGKWKLKDKV